MQKFIVLLYYLILFDLYYCIFIVLFDKNIILKFVLFLVKLKDNTIIYT